MIKRINDKNVIYAYNLAEKDYDLLSEKLEMDKIKIKNMTNEEIFTPRILKSDWEIYKLYYPVIKTDEKKEKFSWYEILPVVILRKEDKIVVIDEDCFKEFYEFVEQYVEKNGQDLKTERFLLNMLHSLSQSLYKYVRFLIGEHDQLETLLREKKASDELISLSEVEQGFYIYNIALKNLNYVVENISEESEFKQYDEYMTKILQEINFTMDLASSYSEICKTTRETYSSYIDNNMNITMKILAAVTILFSVPNMIFGFYGMNVLLPFQDKGFFALGLIFVIMTVIMTILWKYMKKKIL